MKSMQGKGAIQWAPYLLTLFLDSGADAIEYEAKQILQNRLFSFQIHIPEDNFSFDNAKKDNMKKLVKLAREYIKTPSGSNQFSRALFMLNWKDVNELDD